MGLVSYHIDRYEWMTLTLFHLGVKFLKVSSTVSARSERCLVENINIPVSNPIKSQRKDLIFASTEVDL